MWIQNLIALVLIAMLGCSAPSVKRQSTNYVLNATGDRIEIIEIDSCEYLFLENSYIMLIEHKGNCKYCTKRRNNIKK